MMTEYRKDSPEAGLRILARMIARAHLKAAPAKPIAAVNSLDRKTKAVK